MFLSKYTCDDCDKIYAEDTVSATTTTTSAKNNNNRNSFNSHSSSGIIQQQPEIKLATAIRHHPSIGKQHKQQQQRPKSFESNHKRRYDSPDTTNSFELKQQSTLTPKSEENSTQLLEFCRKYLGRRGRRKGSFHLKRDLVSYRTLTLQRANLSQLNYQLIRPEIESICTTTTTEQSSSLLPDSSAILDNLDSVVGSADLEIVDNNIINNNYYNKENNGGENNSISKRNKRRKYHNKHQNLNRTVDVKNLTKLETDLNSRSSSISVDLQNHFNSDPVLVVPESDNGDDEEVEKILSTSSNHKTKRTKMRKVKFLNVYFEFIPEIFFFWL